MRNSIGIATVLLAGAVLVSAAAAGAVHPSNLANFQAICLKSNDLCRYIELDFSPDGGVGVHNVVFVPVESRAAAVFWNQHARTDVARGERGAVQVAVWDPQTSSWSSVPVSPECPTCIPDTREHSRGKRWVRFETNHEQSWQPEHSLWSFTKIVGRQAHQRLFVVVSSPHGPVVYASSRNSGMQYQVSTRDSGTFRVLLESDWVPSARPDFVVISTVRSWVDVSRAYAQAQRQALTGSSQLPEFTGSTDQIIEAAVHYIASRSIHYDEKPDEGGYPHQDVAKILAAGRTDCKGFTTLLYALLHKSGVQSHPVMFNASGMTPSSFAVPDGAWLDHVMLYIPVIDRYVDLTVSLPSHGQYTWRTSADGYTGDVVLDSVTGSFRVVGGR